MCHKIIYYFTCGSMGWKVNSLSCNDHDILGGHMGRTANTIRKRKKYQNSNTHVKQSYWYKVPL